MRTRSRWKKLGCFAVSILFVQLCCAQQEYSVERILLDLAFKPHFPTEQEMIKVYGEGSVVNQGGNRYRIYYLQKNHLWLRLRVNAEDQIENPVTAILVSNVPLGNEKYTSRREVEHVSLRGVRLGDKASDVKRNLGEPLRRYAADVGTSRGMTVLEFFPDDLDLGSCIRVFLQNNVVSALSFSSEE